MTAGGGTVTTGAGAAYGADAGASMTLDPVVPRRLGMPRRSPLSELIPMSVGAWTVGSIFGPDVLFGDALLCANAPAGTISRPATSSNFFMPLLPIRMSVNALDVGGFTKTHPEVTIGTSNALR